MTKGKRGRAHESYLFLTVWLVINTPLRRPQVTFHQIPVWKGLEKTPRKINSFTLSLWTYSKELSSYRDKRLNNNHSSRGVKSVCFLMYLPYSHEAICAIRKSDSKSHTSPKEVIPQIRLHKGSPLWLSLSVLPKTVTEKMLLECASEVLIHLQS